MRIVGLNFKNEPIVFSPTLEDGTVLDSIRIAIAPKTDSVKWGNLAKKTKQVGAYSEYLGSQREQLADKKLSFEEFCTSAGDLDTDKVYFQSIKEVVEYVEVDTLDGEGKTVVERFSFELLEQWVEDPTFNFVLAQLVGFVGEQSNFLQQPTVTTKKK
jgi:hypothetical protein